MGHGVWDMGQAYEGEAITYGCAYPALMTARSSLSQSCFSCMA
jgi:hypothetical protein